MTGILTGREDVPFYWRLSDVVNLTSFSGLQLLLDPTDKARGEML